MTEGEVSLATADDKCSKHLSALVVMATFLSVGGVVIVKMRFLKRRSSLSLTVFLLEN